MDHLIVRPSKRFGSENAVAGTFYYKGFWPVSLFIASKFL